MRRLTKMLISGTLIASMGLTAGAYSYKLNIMNPFNTSLTSTTTEQVSGSTPYVSPNVASSPTGYFLSARPESIDQATNIVGDITTPGRRYFTYKPGFGGSGNRYCLSAYPTEINFLDYVVQGTWMR